MARDDQDHQSEGCPGIKPPDPSSQLHPAQPRRSEVPANFQSPHLRAILWFPIGNNRIEVSLSASRPRVTGTWPHARRLSVLLSLLLAHSHTCTQTETERNTPNSSMLAHLRKRETRQSCFFLTHTNIHLHTVLLLSLALGVVVNTVEGHTQNPNFPNSISAPVPG